MRLLILVFLLCTTLAGCADSTSPLASQPDVDPQLPTEPGLLVVHVYWERGQPDKQVAILETLAVGVTDVAGLAEFSLAPGNYTVRAWDIGMPGPGMAAIDFTVTVRSGETTRLEIPDCVPCV